MHNIGAPSPLPPPLRRPRRKQVMGSIVDEAEANKVAQALIETKL